MLDYEREIKKILRATPMTFFAVCDGIQMKSSLVESQTFNDITLVLEMMLSKGEVAWEGRFLRLV